MRRLREDSWRWLVMQKIDEDITSNTRLFSQKEKTFSAKQVENTLKFTTQTSTGVKHWTLESLLQYNVANTFKKLSQKTSKAFNVLMIRCITDAQRLTSNEHGEHNFYTIDNFFFGESPTKQRLTKLSKAFCQMFRGLLSSLSENFWIEVKSWIEKLENSEVKHQWSL